MSSSSPAPDPTPVSGQADARWFAEEVQLHEPALRAFLRARFPSVGDLDDLVQEAYARLFRARQVGQVRNAKSFLFTTARNAACDLFRHNRIVTMEPLVSAESSSVLEDRPSIQETVNSVHELEILQQAIDALPERCREVMMLQKIHGLANRQIAERMGISIHTVNAQVVIGLMRCREYLRARGILRGKQP